MKRIERIRTYIENHRIVSLILAALFLLYWFCLPNVLFQNPTSTVIESKEGTLLGAKIAADEQWRFPNNDQVPEKFAECIILFEDEYFYKHIGINPVSIFNALKTNLKSRKIKRGGSTLTQQTIRLARKNKQRSYIEKVIEAILATRLELKYSKKKILYLYTSNAPFGGNVVGLDAASWRYFNRPATQLSWSESATMAVLPNAPSLIYPGSNQEKLRIKRNRLLLKLLKKKKIDSLTYQLAITETLPQKPYALPQIAPHLLQEIHKNQRGQRIQTSIDEHLQKQTNQIVAQHYNQNKTNEIYNAAVLILDVHTRKVLAYVGNTPTIADHQHQVDIIHKPRSTGSILKPFLYCNMLTNGEILQSTLVADIPTQYGSYTPQNFDNQFTGAISAKRALAKSLNVPSVRMLKQHGVEKFHSLLQTINLVDVDQSANHYGLSLILGGAESNLWDLCKTYASMASTLTHFQQHDSQYFANEFIEPSYFNTQNIQFGKLQDEPIVFDAASIYFTFDSMKEVNRPEGDENWQFFDSSKQIAWKTGTSFGFRDAWSIGVTQDFVVGVWVGNADGEGRPGLVGLQVAAPLLFDVFSLLPQSDWFDFPYDESAEAFLCQKSGYLAQNQCVVDTTYIPISGLKSAPCPYHKVIHLDKTEQFRVHSDCEQIENITTKSAFVLPPIMAYYYKKNNSFYKDLPPYRDDCYQENEPIMQFIYPEENQKIFLPKNVEGQLEQVVIKVAHRSKKQKVYWYLDDQFIDETTLFHEIGIQPEVGQHTLTVVDGEGNRISRKIIISL